MLDDEQLLDFDAKQLAEPADARALLREHGEVFRSQLVAARWIEFWCEGVARSAGGPMGATREPGWAAGVEWALREVAAHLRQGDFLLGGSCYEQEQRRGDR